MNKFKIVKALQLLDKYDCYYNFRGNSEVVLTQPKSIDKLNNNGLSFLHRNNIQDFVKLFNPTNLVILKNENIELLPIGNYIFTENPSLCFNIIATLFKLKKPSFIHPTALIDESVKMGRGIFVGPYSVISKEVEIGDNCVVKEHCVIKNAVLGNNVKIQSGVKIGNRGLGSIIDKSGEWHDFPHFGKVIIGNNVVIQDNTIINRGTLNDTVINNKTRIGSLCWIAHGVHIGQSCFISSGTSIAGSARIGDYTKIWINSSIRDGISIGSNSIIGMGSVVTKNISKNKTWIGNSEKYI